MELERKKLNSNFCIRFTINHLPVPEFVAIVTAAKNHGNNLDSNHKGDHCDKNF